MALTGWGWLAKTWKWTMTGLRKLTFAIMVRAGLPEGCWESVATPVGSSETGSSEPASAHYSSGPAGSSWSLTVTAQREKTVTVLILFQLLLLWLLLAGDSSRQSRTTFPLVLPNIIILALERRCISIYAWLPLWGKNSSFTFGSVWSQFKCIFGITLCKCGAIRAEQRNPECLT